jgi:pimeloyl-ACP methyl ester carboxylesterase
MYLTTTDGSRIAYNTYGDIANPAVVLLHGNGGSQNTFKKHVPLLVAQGYFVVTQDARGHGHSTSATKMFSFDQFVDDLEQVRETIGVATWAIIGYSDGANLALQYAKEHLNRVTKLVLNAPNIKTNGLHVLFVIGAKLTNWGLHALSIVSDVFRSKWLRARIMFETPDISWTDLRHISVPTLVIVGQFDVIKRQHSKDIALALPNSDYLVMPLRTHIFLETAPNEFLKAVLPFLGSR